MTVWIAFFTSHSKFLVGIFSSFVATTLPLIAMQGLPFLCPSLKHWCSCYPFLFSSLLVMLVDISGFVHCYNFRFIIPQSFCSHSFCIYYYLHCLFCVSPLFFTWENSISPSRLSLPFNFRYTFSYPVTCPFLPLSFPSRLGATCVPLLVCIPSSSCILRHNYWLLVCNPPSPSPTDWVLWEQRL